MLVCFTSNANSFVTYFHTSLQLTYLVCEIILTCCHLINLLEPPSITDISRNQKVIVGKDVTTLNLYCIAVGRPVPNVTWIKVSDDRIVTFPLNISGEEDEGTYRCTADNGVGNSVTRDVSITVQGKFSLICNPLAFSFMCDMC